MGLAQHWQGRRPVNTCGRNQRAGHLCGPLAPRRHERTWAHDHRRASQLCRSPDVRAQFLSGGPTKSQGTEEEMPGVWQTTEGVSR